jgi:hypothetical protein
MTVAKRGHRIRCPRLCGRSNTAPNKSGTCYCVSPALREYKHRAIAIERSGETDKTDTKERCALVVGRAGRSH